MFLFNTHQLSELMGRAGSSSGVKRCEGENKDKDLAHLEMNV